MAAKILQLYRPGNQNRFNTFISIQYSPSGLFFFIEMRNSVLEIFHFVIVSGFGEGCHH